MTATLPERLRAVPDGPLRREHDGRPLYTLHPARGGEAFAASTPPRVVLSRFAVLHRVGNELVLESPRAWCDVAIHDDAVAALLAAAVRPVDADALAALAPPAVVATVLGDLVAARILVPVEESEEDTDLRLRQWGVAEAWLHARSRLGTGQGIEPAWGLTAWADGVFAPLPARRDPFAAPLRPLPEPDLDALRASDPPLTAVLEDRCSVRAHDPARPLTADQLGEFLYRCARVRATIALDGIEHVDRPFPSGGGLHELEFYVLANAVDGLDRGLHHYDGHDHGLRLVSPWTEATENLLLAAHLAADTADAQAVILLTARFGRLMWKYEAMGYAAILKDVGVAYAHMYAVATAMGLAPCGLGGGHAELLNDIAGLDYLTESAVGEFLLGTRRTN